MIVALSLWACSGSEPPPPPDSGTPPDPTCEVVEPRFSACMLGGPEQPTTYTYGYGALSGRVEVVDEGAQLAASCRDGWVMNERAEEVFRDASSEWLQLEHEDGSLSLLGLSAEGFGLPDVEVGDELQLDFASQPYAYQPDEGRLVLRDAQGKLLLALGEAGVVDDLPLLPELSITKGLAVCTQSDECVGSWEQYAMVVDGEPPTILLPGEEASVDGYRVRHAGFREQTGPTTCLDAFVQDVKVAIWAE